MANIRSRLSSVISRRVVRISAHKNRQAHRSNFDLKLSAASATEAGEERSSGIHSGHSRSPFPLGPRRTGVAPSPRRRAATLSPSSDPVWVMAHTIPLNDSPATPVFSRTDHAVPSPGLCADCSGEVPSCRKDLVLEHRIISQRRRRRQARMWTLL